MRVGSGCRRMLDAVSGSDKVTVVIPGRKRLVVRV